jgi:hypothetical protein
MKGPAPDALRRGSHLANSLSRLMCLRSRNRTRFTPSEATPASDYGRFCCKRNFAHPRAQRWFKIRRQQVNVDSKVHPSGFDCCVFLFYSFCAATFAQNRPYAYRPTFRVNVPHWDPAEKKCSRRVIASYTGTRATGGISVGSSNPARWPQGRERSTECAGPAAGAVLPRATGAAPPLA